MSIFFIVSRVNQQTKNESKPQKQKNRKIQLWIGLALLLVILTLFGAAVTAYFLTGKPVVTFKQNIIFVSGLD